MVEVEGQVVFVEQVAVQFREGHDVGDELFGTFPGLTGRVRTISSVHSSLILPIIIKSSSFSESILSADHLGGNDAAVARR